MLFSIIFGLSENGSGQRNFLRITPRVEGYGKISAGSL